MRQGCGNQPRLQNTRAARVSTCGQGGGWSLDLKSAAISAGGSSCLGSSFADPVFVLCHARSGSTLLRFVLDAHPDLACPPETNVPALCAQLATVWSLIEGAPLSASRGDEPPLIPDAAIAGVRETMDRMTGSYLLRRGRKRYCDKSLGTARYAELLLRVYPDAKFICLYRHPMDVIASGVEACPWGLNGYGFDSYIAATPGNAVLALARYWADGVGAILAVEERFPGHCVRVRYEDLVTDPDAIAGAVFAFLGAMPVPGIAARCFTAERERFGAGDPKIWYTSAISPGSVGRGWSIPAGLIPPQVLDPINELAAKLGYLPVDDGWGTSAPPADPRLPAAGITATAPGTHAVQERAVTFPGAEIAPSSGPVYSRLLGKHLQAGVEQAGSEVAAWREPYASETMVAVWVPADSHQPAEHWLIDLKNKVVTFTTSAAQETSDWDVIGSSSAWEQVMAGALNLATALSSGQLRYCDSQNAASPLAGAARIAVLASLLGIATW
jgi:hypothetical protein